MKPPTFSAARAAFIVSVFIFGLVIGPSMASASAASLPGDPLYGVKRALEDTQYFFADAQTRIQLESDFASRRLEEVNLLVEQGRSGRVEFSGRVERQVGKNWLVAGKHVIVARANIVGNPVVGDFVVVVGTLRADRTVLATQIRRTTATVTPPPGTTNTPVPPGATSTMYPYPGMTNTPILPGPTSTMYPYPGVTNTPILPGPTSTMYPYPGVTNTPILPGPTSTMYPYPGVTNTPIVPAPTSTQGHGNPHPTKTPKPHHTQPPSITSTPLPPLPTTTPYPYPVASPTPRPSVTPYPYP